MAKIMGHSAMVRVKTDGGEWEELGFSLSPIISVNAMDVPRGDLDLRGGFGSNTVTFTIKPIDPLAYYRLCELAGYRVRPPFPMFYAFLLSLILILLSLIQ